MATLCSWRATAELYEGMSVRSATGAECAPTPTWPEGPKIGRRRPGASHTRGHGDQVTDGSTPNCRSAGPARRAYMSEGQPRPGALRAPLKS